MRTERDVDVVVVGCGVSGLTCGVRLREAGYATTIVTREVSSETTSAVAAATWYPYRAYPEEKVLAWGKKTLEAFYDLARITDSGVAPTTLIELFDQTVPDPWWRSAVGSFRRATPEELRPGYADGYVVEVPLIETPAYLGYLEERFRKLGGRIEHLPDGLESLAELHQDGRLIVNCTGLGARALANDPDVYPIRGQVVRVENPGLTRCILDERGPLSLTYIIPRRKDCILGGTAEDHVWDLEVDPKTTQEILRRCVQLEPRLREARVYESAVGLRPARSQVRLEFESVTLRCGLIHNYGHGGAGFTLSWGCAQEVLELTRTFFTKDAIG